MYNINKL